MDEKQFTQLTSATRIKPGGLTHAALRAVLIDGKRPAEACKEVGIARATLCKAMAKVGVKITYTT